MSKTKSRPPNHTVHLLDRNFSSRGGAPIQAIAVHSTESSDIKASWDDLHGVRSWFNNPASQASSHLGIDGDGHVEKWVKDVYKAWTILELNNRTLNIEFVGRAAQGRAAWEHDQIHSGARWVAWWSINHNIPIQRGKVKNVNGYPVITRRGVIKHSDLTNAGFGSHTDPGANFPMRRFLDLAREYKRDGWPKVDAGQH